jgi:hypothetical protein
MSLAVHLFVGVMVGVRQITLTLLSGCIKIVCALLTTLVPAASFY